jgi:hypothetical protein
MWKAIKEFVLSCDTYVRSKNPQYRPYEFLQLLPIPRQPWFSVFMDFITDLPSLRNFDGIFVIVDRLTKTMHFVPCNKTIIREETVRLFVDNVYRYHGLSDDIISNRKPQFVFEFWKSLFEILKMDIKLFFAFHPQTDG